MAFLEDSLPCLLLRNNSNAQVMKLYASETFRRGDSAGKESLGDPREGAGPRASRHGHEPRQSRGALRVTGAYAQAEPLLKRARAIREKALGPEHPDTATSLNNLAGLYRAMGDYAQAEPLYQRALAIREKALGPEHPDTATSLNNLAGLYEGTGAYAQAEPLFKRALAIVEKALGPEHPDTATSLNNLAGLYQAMGDYTQAEPLFKRRAGDPGKGARPRASRHGHEPQQSRPALLGPSALVRGCWQSEARCTGP